MLRDAGLPSSDLGPDRLAYFLIAERSESDQSAAIGVIGLQQFDNVGLLRSLVVNESDRRSGLGKRLVAALEANATCSGIKDLWLLTIDAERYFEQLGYKMMSRESVPDSIRNTEEFRHLCPDGAYLMRKAIG